MSRWMLPLVPVAACGSPSSPRTMEDAAPSYSYSISVGDPMVDANPFAPRTITVTGMPGDQVVVTLDRATAGMLEATELTLDASGQAMLGFTPCPAVLPDCVGNANLALALTAAPMTAVADQTIALFPPLEVGEVAPCQTSANVASIHGSLVNGTYTSAPTDDWAVEVHPDQIHFAIGLEGNRYQGQFSLVQIDQPIAPGVYQHAQRDAFVDLGHPGIDILAPSRGCNKIDGRFKVHDYTADPATGAVLSATISFEEVCEYTPEEPQQPWQFTVGCFHYQTTPPTPPTPPAPDPTKVSVEVRSTTTDRAPDPTAIAIFTDASGTVVLDTMVNSFGQAEVSLPAGGSVTTIQIGADNREYLTTYRAVHNGDHLVVNPMLPESGVEDQMQVTLLPPTRSNGMILASSCGNGDALQLAGTAARSLLSFHDGCRPSTFDLLSIATFASGDRQFVWQTGLPHVPNGNVVVPSSWTPMALGAVAVTNLPANSPSIHTAWATRVGSRSVVSDELFGIPTSTTEVRSLEYPMGAGNAVVITVDKPGFLVLASDMWTVVDTSMPSGVTIDVTSQPLPLPTAIQQTQTGATWTQSTGGTADLRRLTWRVQTSTHRAMWTLIEPYDGTANITLPTLPAAHAALDPTTDAGAQLKGVSVIVTDYNVAGFTLQSPPTGSYRAHEAYAETFAMTQPF